MSKITWTNEVRKLGDLTPWPINPRQINKTEAARLSQSLDEFAQVETIAIGPGDEVYNGHQRLNVWMSEHGPDYEVDVRVASRELTEDERKKLTVFLHKGATGEWDFDLLANNFDVDDLLDWGFDSKELDLDLWDIEDDKYTRNIEAPIYEPKGPKPSIQELYDDTRALELIHEIEAADLPEDEKEFLRVAARRHTVLNFQRVAEYYAHSDEKVQALMENSALVIIDFDRAIELGYVKLSEKIAEQYKEDYPNA